VWCVAIALVIASQAVSAAVYPRSWDFALGLSVEGSGPWAVLRNAVSLWSGLWQQRPLEALSITIVFLALLFTMAWLAFALIRSGNGPQIVDRNV
jgi:hypothetical protein